MNRHQSSMPLPGLADVLDRLDMDAAKEASYQVVLARVEWMHGIQAEDRRSILPHCKG
jgi:hypothetical protein